jgi:diguanylate cyclase (GGDEF)-like protein/PAS domain S-box-containing protein
MPGMGGNMVCASIRSLMTQPPPILMVTAIDNEETVDRSFAAGAMDYIRKPIHWSVLKNRIRYIIEASRATSKLDQMKRNYELILYAAANGICQIDEKKRISFMNPAGLDLLGYQADEVIMQPYENILLLKEPDGENVPLELLLQDTSKEGTEEIHFDQLHMIRKDQVHFPVDLQTSPILKEQGIVGWVVLFQNLTEKEEAAAMIRHMANHDSLTNLRNRNFFLKRLPQAISLAKRYERYLYLLFIDLDRFKPINDTYGHSVGDKVLQIVAQRLTSMLRSSDSVCRLGGDEFVILLESTKDLKGAENVAAKTIELLNQVIEVEGVTCYIGASIGISEFPHGCTDAETMLRQADIAMYQAKNKGRNCYALYRETDEAKDNSG